MHRFLIQARQPWRRLVLVAGLLAATAAAQAGPIALDTYLQFSFETAGAAVTGCQPDDPDGQFCIASSGTPSSFLDAPAWTFNAGAAGATLSVTDAFTAGDVFQVFDFGVLLGSTSAPTDGVDCLDDPLVCLSTAGMSTGLFALGAGAHSLSLVAALVPSGAGSGYLHVAAAAAAVPEPASIALVLAALVAARASHRRPVAPRSRN